MSISASASPAPAVPATQETTVSGTIRTIACREGSSGVFTGSLAGLYQGYRLGSTTPDVQPVSLETPHGTLVLELTQQIVTPLPPRPAVHPFAGGADPFAGLASTSHGAGGSRPAHHEARGSEGGRPIFKRVHYMESTVRADPDRSTGIFAGATGAFELDAPAYRMPGYLVIRTDDGDVCLQFLEKGSRDVLEADLWVDGTRSTGRYAGATGTLTFSLRVTPPFYGEGTYEGVVQLAA